MYLEWQNARPLAFLSIIGVICVYFTLSQFLIYISYLHAHRMESRKIINDSDVYFSCRLINEPPLDVGVARIPQQTGAHSSCAASSEHPPSK